MSDRAPYTGDRRRHVAMPLGGIGTGNVALGATGVLKQWQLHHQGNHLGFLPQAFFGLRLLGVEPPLHVRRVLQSPPVDAHPEPAPEVNDQLDAAGDYQRPFAWDTVATTAFSGAYPFARIAYEDDWPVDVRLEAYTPFVPLDAEASGLPLVSFTFTVTNRFVHDIGGWLLGTLQNVVGWDGVTPIRDASCAVLGGNVNQGGSLAGGTAVRMSNPGLDPLHPGAGTMTLWSPSPAAVLPQFDDADTALAFVDSLKLLGPTVLEDWSPAAVARSLSALRPPVAAPSRPSNPGSTWAAGLAVPFHLAPGETATVEIVHAWHFPNRYNDFDAFGAADETLPRPTWIGNAYTQHFTGADQVVERYAHDRVELHDASVRWSDAIHQSTLPDVVVDVLEAQPSLIRSPTTFRTADGHFYGYEGVLGESTLNWNGNVGGSCPLNCTHVWNYEQALSRLFPELERSMRETDWDVLQAPEGYLPHRVLLPRDRPQLHGRPIGGPTRPALDGMLGTVLKTYREARQGAGIAWLEGYLPHMRRLMDYASETWDPDETGVLTGDQPVTHDISLQGANMYVGGLWLAALRTMEVVLEVTGNKGESVDYARRLAQASTAYDDLLWSGEYYSQSSEGEAFDFGSGCLADQLFGQAWAHQLGLGHVLPRDHVRTALASIVRYNHREGFRGFEHGYRVFADADDSGLLICTWPHGGRPDVPIRYADEVWTGVEYQVAAHCLYEGLQDEGLLLLRSLRGRYDGSRRNPYNEIECGDHYSRAMAGWAVLEALTGSSYDALSGHAQLGLGATRYPFLAATGWGEVRVDGRSVSLVCRGGIIAIQSLTVPGTAAGLYVNGEPVATAAEGDRTRPLGPVMLTVDERLVVTLAGR
ncbi:non-lysosomal glucosylceramidase [Acidothermaceae bacterium B102]|nr:non-lysosomal glucosylceramidase [Acidothermaceae bacterium B102]